MVQVHVLFGAVVEILAGHPHPVVAVLIAFVDAGQGGADQRRNHIDRLTRGGGIRADNRVQAEAHIPRVVHRIVPPEEQRQVFARFGIVKNIGIVIDGHLFPVAHLVWRWEIGHLIDPAYGYLLGAEIAVQHYRQKQEKLCGQQQHGEACGCVGVQFSEVSGGEGPQCGDVSGCRARVPAGRRTWPAIWMLDPPRNYGALRCGWRCDLGCGHVFLR